MKKKLIWTLISTFTLAAIASAFLYAKKLTAPTVSQRSTQVEVTTTLTKDTPNLPEHCAEKKVSQSSCDGQTQITTAQGNTYNLVEIGNQCWFADNAKEIPTTNQGWYGYYNDAETESTSGEGLLYTWDAAMNGETEERAQGICPEGWHIPSQCEVFQKISSLTPQQEDSMNFKIDNKEELKTLLNSKIIGKRSTTPTWYGINTSSYSHTQKGANIVIINGPEKDYVSIPHIQEHRGEYKCLKN